MVYRATPAAKQVNQSRVVTGLSIPDQLLAIRGAPQSLSHQVHYYILGNGKRKCCQLSLA